MIDKFIIYLKYEKNYSEHTITAYENDLISFRDFCAVTFDDDSIIDVGYNQIRSWIVSLAEADISNRSINRKVSSLSGFYKFLQKIGEIKLNPLAKHKPLKVQKKVQIPFTKAETQKAMALDLGEDEFTSVRDKLIIELFYSTGIRRAELINIKECDVDFYNNVIKVLGKRHKERFVPLLSSVKETLNRYLELKEEYALDKNYLFITKKGVKIYESLVYRIINSYFSTVSTKEKKSPHMLRHTFATHLLNQGADMNSVKELLGHSSLASTQVYTHNSLEQLKKVFNQAHPRSDKKL